MTMNKMLTLGSLFDGSGGFPLGGLLAGITPVWASEIEPFPIRVTTKRLPQMKHYGDVSAMDGSKIDSVDIITFGSPCQDMSIAGKRDGLDGNRSSLFYEAIRIIKEMRYATNGKYPRYIVWENVPGAFSSNKGEDFKSVLEAIIGIVSPNAEVPMPEKARWAYADILMGDGWSVAYRVLDAQYWGVPQRRRRIFLVADFNGRSAGKVLFKSEGLSGYSAESFRSWQRTAGRSEGSTYATGFDGYNGCLTGDTEATLGVNCGVSTGRNGVVLNDQGGNRMDVTDSVTGTLRAEAHHPPCVLSDASLKNNSYASLENHSNDSRVKLSNENKVQTLTSRMGTGGMNVPLVMKIRSGCEGGGKGALIQEDKSATLSCNNDQTLFEPCAWDGSQVSSTLTSCNAGGAQRMPDKENFNCVLQPFGICSKDSNSMKSNNPASGFYKAETARTLDGNGGNPSCNQGGIAVVESFSIQGSMIGRKDENGPQGDGINENVSFTLNTTDRHAVYTMTTGSFIKTEKEKSPTLLARDFKDPTAISSPTYGIGRDAINQGQNAKFSPSVYEEVQPTMVAKGPGGVMQASSEYTVRRLTPTECARLQGFPDWWCSGLETEEPTMEEIHLWYDIFETHRKIIGTSGKAKSLKQVVKWLKAPRSDATEYKMWGNGVALPCVYFVLSGIALCAQSASCESKK